MEEDQTSSNSLHFDRGKNLTTTKIVIKTSHLKARLFCAK